MFSIADMAVAGAVALLLFGPEQLPKVARRAGQMVRDVQNTSQSFIREMERAADAVPDAHDPAPPAAIAAMTTYHEAPEPAAHELVAREAALDPHAQAREAELDPHAQTREEELDPSAQSREVALDPHAQARAASLDPHAPSGDAGGRHDEPHGAGTPLK